MNTKGIFNNVKIKTGIRLSPLLINIIFGSSGEYNNKRKRNMVKS